MGEPKTTTRGDWPAPLDHKCTLPRRRERKKRGLGHRAVIECHCGRPYEFIVTEFGSSWWPHNMGLWQAIAANETGKEER